MIYTSYFGNIRKLPEDAILISIARSTPKWFKGEALLGLAPSYQLLNEWKKGNITTTEYERWYRTEVSDRYTYLEEIEEEILSCVDGELCHDIILLCYEKTMDFCHRHILAEMMCECGVDVREWE